MAIIIFTYSAKPGKTAEFEKFLMEVDQPKVRELPSVQSVQIYRLRPAGPFAYLEVVSITSRADWDRDHERPDVRAVVEAFAQYGEITRVRLYDADLV